MTYPLPPAPAPVAPKPKPPEAVAPKTELDRLKEDFKAQQKYLNMVRENMQQVYEYLDKAKKSLNDIHTPKVELHNSMRKMQLNVISNNKDTAASVSRFIEVAYDLLITTDKIAEEAVNI